MLHRFAQEPTVHFLALLNCASIAYSIYGTLSIACPPVVCPSDVSVAIISKPIGQISFKFQLLLALGHSPRLFFELLKNKMHFLFFSHFFFFFVNMRPYGSKNFKTLPLHQITFGSFQAFSEFSSQWSSQKYCFAFIHL